MRAAHEIGLRPKMFGGALIGPLVTPTKIQHGAPMNRIAPNEAFPHAPAFIFPGTREMLAKYQAIGKEGTPDSLGWRFPPVGYSAGQVLAEAIEATKIFDNATLAQYMHTHEFKAAVGPISFGKNGK